MRNYSLLSCIALLAAGCTENRPVEPSASEQAQLSERYIENHPEMTKIKSAVESATAKLTTDIAKVV